MRQTADSEGWTWLARGRFPLLIFDLDNQQIVNFLLNPRAVQYLVLRAAARGARM